MVRELSLLLSVLSLSFSVACGGASQTPVESGDGSGDEGGAKPASASLQLEGEVHLADIVQLTRDSGENAEAYWSFDGTQLIFQTHRPPYKCDQIMRVPADGSAEPTLVSTGKGRTTCSYFLPGDKRTVWSSTHLSSDECPPVPDHSKGYVWPIYAEYEVFTSDPDGGNLTQLTKNDYYDAEATVCAKDGSIIFTSMRDGDLDLYRMDKDGQNVVRLTDTPGYDGGAFFSADCSKIVWRASRPTGDALADYQRLLSQGLVRPSRLEVFVADADGKNARQVTYLNSASFAPFFHPSGKRILFSTNYPDPRGREFDIYAIDVDGGNLERITYAPGFDGFPMFSPDGTRLAFASNRNQAKPRETDVYVARWVEDGKGESVELPADQLKKDIAWLSSDSREGRGVGSDGLEAAAMWLAAQMQEIGVKGGVEGDRFHQALEVPVDARVTDATALSVRKDKVARADYTPASFSANGKVKAKTVYVGYGLVSKERKLDDYRRKNVRGKIAVIRRFLPPELAIDDEAEKRRLSDLHFKAFLARERGAVGVIFADLADPPKPKKGAKPAPTLREAELPEVTAARGREIGIPVVVVKRAVGEALKGRSVPVEMNVAIETIRSQEHNIVGVVRAQGNRLPGAVVVGAHFDHLGMGGEGSLEPGVEAIHNGADDNASGTAALLAVGRHLVGRASELRRDVYLVAFTAEESGLIGSTHFTRNPPPGLKLDETVAMINMDMVGRLRENRVAVIGGETADEWASMVEPACKAARIQCKLGGSGYGPSDQTPFYAAKVPVLHFFTGAHGDYHKTTDDIDHVNAGGAAQIAAAVAGVAMAAANRDGRLTYRRVAPPPPRGDTRSRGASLGTIPDYTGGDDDKPGVLLSGVRPGGPAEKGGIRGGDRILKIGKTEVRTVQDLVWVLARAEPGQRVPVVVERDGKRVTLRVTYGKARRRGPR